jgi:hypothetical protein
MQHCPLHRSHSHRNSSNCNIRGHAWSDRSPLSGSPFVSMSRAHFRSVPCQELHLDDYSSTISTQDNDTVDTLVLSATNLLRASREGIQNICTSCTPWLISPIQHPKDRHSSHPEPCACFLPFCIVRWSQYIWLSSLFGRQVWNLG